MKKGVIYTLTNKVTGSVYIGATHRYKARKLQHMAQLRRGVHGNINIQKDFDFFGKEVFEFKVLFEVQDLNKLEEIETRLIRESNPSLTYNIAVGVMNNLARHPNKEEILEKMRLSKLGEGNPNWKGGISLVNCVDCGISISQDSERCIECYFKQRDVSGDKNSFYGKTHSKETKKKMSKAKLGKKTKASRAVIVRGVRYETVSVAARQIGVNISTLNYWIKNPRPKYSEYYYEEEL